MKKKARNMDAVKMMRDIRDRLSEKYYKNTETLFKDMEKVRKKYKFPTKNIRVV
jgi:hypothetical protein